MGRIAVDVTQEDIDKAIRQDSARCVVAQAIARTVPDAARITVDVQTVRFTDGRGVRRVYLTPASVEQYVIGFDAGDKIEPFGFGLYDSQRVNIKRKTSTAAGRKRDAAAKKARERKARAEQIEADPSASAEEKAVAKQRAEAAAEERERAWQDTQGEPGATTLTPHEEGIITKPSARTVRPKQNGGAASNLRTYGHRVLRINQRAE